VWPTGERAASDNFVRGRYTTSFEVMTVNDAIKYNNIITIPSNMSKIVWAIGQQLPPHDHTLYIAAKFPVFT